MNISSVSNASFLTMITLHIYHRIHLSHPTVNTKQKPTDNKSFDRENPTEPATVFFTDRSADFELYVRTERGKSNKRTSRRRHWQPYTILQNQVPLTNVSTNHRLLRDRSER